MSNSQQLARYAYSFVLYLCSPFIILYLLWRSRAAPEYRRRWTERFVWHVPHAQGVIWIHAVSVGETMAALPLVRLIQKHFPKVRILVTTTTPTGSERVKHELGDSVAHFYVPYDLPGAVNRFIDAVNPRLVVMMETEIWPNIFHHCGIRSIPIIIANARVSSRSFQRYKQFPKLTANTLSNVTAFVTQSNQDALRLIEMGAPKQRVRVTGNMKYDLTVPDEIKEFAVTLREQSAKDRLVWIAASTHRGEDEQILLVFAKLLKRRPNLLLILVPRHPERFEQVAALCEEQGFSIIKRSEQKPCEPKTQIYVGDTMGELLLLYAIADVAFVGGSLVPHGGQNMLEPAALAKPVIFGPYTENFTDISEQLISADAALRVQDPEELFTTVETLMEDKERRLQMGTNAAKVVELNRGALKALFVLVSPVIITAAAGA